LRKIKAATTSPADAVIISVISVELIGRLILVDAYLLLSLSLILLLLFLLLLIYLLHHLLLQVTYFMI
jgi:hypothetical protein